MKAIINSLRRTHWFQASAAFLTCLLFLVIPSCQKDEFSQDSIPELDLMSSSALSKKDKLKPGTIRDVEGNVYKTVKIGKQYWMAENLKTTMYRNGELIETTDPPAKYILGEIEPKYQWVYNGDESFFLTDYGRLYTWYTVTDNRGVCPEGWHVPTDAEWTTLSNYLGGESVAGGKLKETGTTHWYSPNTGATNETGFTGRPGGNRLIYNDLAFFHYKQCGVWWTSTESSYTFAWFRLLAYTEIYFPRWEYDKGKGLSVRCVKDN